MTNPFRLRKFWPALAALLILLNVGTLLAQEERWLLIFDTSANMKKRLPALDSEVEKLLLASTGEHIHAGASVGIWAFGNNQLHAGQLPLITYGPAVAGAIATNVLGYIHQQHFTGTTAFDPLQPSLGNVIQNSERLTVIIFCDGEGEIEGTPYDYGINQSMTDAIAGQKKAKQPVLVILRTQHGKFIGGTVNLPPVPCNVPAFPPLPVPPKAVPTAAAVVAQALVVPKSSAGIQALIINGTAISTNPDVMPAYVPKTSSQMTNPGLVSYSPTVVSSTPAPAPAANPGAPAPSEASVTPAAPHQPVQATPTVVPVPVPAPTTAPTVASAPAGSATPSTLAAAPAVSEGLDFSTKVLLVVGGVFFGMALLLVIFFLTRSKKPQASLITSMMTDDPTRRK